MTRFGLSRRTRTFLLWTARLALLAYVVQLSAIDHWHTHFADVVGIEGTSAHAQHCHGAGDCSTDAGPAISANAQLNTLLVASGVTFGLDATSLQTPESAYIAPPSQPPQAA